MQFNHKHYMEKWICDIIYESVHTHKIYVQWDYLRNIRYLSIVCRI